MFFNREIASQYIQQTLLGKFDPYFASAYRVIDSEGELDFAKVRELLFGCNVQPERVAKVMLAVVIRDLKHSFPLLEAVSPLFASEPQPPHVGREPLLGIVLGLFQVATYTDTRPWRQGFCIDNQLLPIVEEIIVAPPDQPYIKLASSVFPNSQYEGLLAKEIKKYARRVKQNLITRQKNIGRLFVRVADRLGIAPNLAEHPAATVPNKLGAFILDQLTFGFFGSFVGFGTETRTQILAHFARAAYRIEQEPVAETASAE